MQRRISQTDLCTLELHRIFCSRTWAQVYGQMCPSVNSPGAFPCDILSAPRQSCCYGAGAKHPQNSISWQGVCTWCSWTAGSWVLPLNLQAKMLKVMDELSMMYFRAVGVGMGMTQDHSLKLRISGLLGVILDWKWAHTGCWLVKWMIQREGKWKQNKEVSMHVLLSLLSLWYIVDDP